MARGIRSIQACYRAPSLDSVSGGAYLRAVDASTPIDATGGRAQSIHAKRRRRPASGAEAKRRQWFGQTFGQANREAGQKVREGRGE